MIYFDIYFDNYLVNINRGNETTAQRWGIESNNCDFQSNIHACVTCICYYYILYTHMYTYLHSSICYIDIIPRTDIHLEVL